MSMTKPCPRCRSERRRVIDKDRGRHAKSRFRNIYLCLDCGEQYTRDGIYQEASPLPFTVSEDPKTMAEGFNMLKIEDGEEW